MTEHRWDVVATFRSGYEADLAIAFLEAAGIDAIRDSNTDTSGIFGPGFQGATSRGISVLVQSGALEDARAVLSR